MRSSSLKNCSLVGVDARSADLREARAEGSIMIGANLGECRLEGAILDDAKWHQGSEQAASLKGALMAGVNFVKADLRWVDMSGGELCRYSCLDPKADLRWVDMSGRGGSAGIHA